MTEIGNSILPDVSGKVPENTELVEALKGVRSITFPEKLLEIGYGNFNGIALLSEVKFGSYLKEICYGSFNNLKSLENVDFPESLEAYRRILLFGNCNKKTEIVTRHPD